MNSEKSSRTFNQRLIAKAIAEKLRADMTMDSLFKHFIGPNNVIVPIRDEKDSTKDS